jgi:hypothetical protein
MQALRLAALTHYSAGQPACACCGDTHIEFLAVDHINGGARTQGNSGTRLHRWLKTHGYPDGFRVLCHNCNQALAFYGYCPHQLAGLTQGSPKGIGLTSDVE